MGQVVSISTEAEEHPGDMYNHRAFFFKASQLMAGRHLPQLYSNLGYSLTNNTHLAEKFFRQALEVALNDPFVLHELSVTLWPLREAGERVQVGPELLPL